MTKCISCKTKIEDGMVRCPGCGANLAPPGAFLQTLGFVVIAVSTIPFALGEVVTTEGNMIPIVAGAVILLLGIVMVVSARMKNRAASPTVVDDAVEESATA